MAPIPVVTLSGFLGAGKTTFLKYILESMDHQIKCAVIVNDMASLNIDARLLKSSNLRQVEEKMVEMQNGCICCTLREDLLIEIKKIASAGVYDLLLIEGTGISEPLQVAETFTFEDDAGLSLSKYAALDTMITMVDAVHFFDYVHSEKTVQDEKSALDENDLRTLSDLLVGQVEFANVILISKCDLVSDAATVGEIEAFVRALNPNALVLRKGKDDRIDLRNVLFTKRFNFEEAAMNPGWMKVLRGAPLVPESEEFGVTSFIYRARRPFHPLRLNELLTPTRPLPNCLRSKGTCWIANHHDQNLVWSSAGSIFNIEPTGHWFADVPRSEWAYDISEVLRDFDGPYGDRRQEIVMIGLRFDHDVVTKLLDSCLVTEEEFGKGPEFWKSFCSPNDDPWSFLMTGGDDDHHHHEEKKKTKKKQKEKKKNKDKKKKSKDKKKEGRKK